MANKRRRGDSDAPLALAPSASQLDHIRTHATRGGRAQAMHLRQSILASAIETSGFPYLHEVKGHRSCINALAFSRGSGQWMASGGDDMRIHVRDLFDYDGDRSGSSETSSYRTRARLLGHLSNIFSLSWSAGNARLVSGGNDNMVYIYDLHYGDAPVRSLRPTVERQFADLSFAENESSVREVSTHPSNPDLLLSSNDGGELFLVDLRLPSPHVAASGFFMGQVESAQWNPSDNHTFVVSTASDPGACAALFDVRHAFLETDRPLDTSDAIVRYASLVRCKRGGGVLSTRPDATGAQFDPSGRFLAVDLSLFHPIVYSVDSSEPLATLSSVAQYPQLDPVNPVLPPRETDGYRNSCTVKRGSFGFEQQTGRLYYAAGSDDFRGYGWRIPSVHELVEQREFMTASDWLASATAGTDCVWFRSVQDPNAMLRVPELSRPVFTLEGSRSIVNSTLCHPVRFFVFLFLTQTLPMIATAGIERLVRLHYATPMSMEHSNPEYLNMRPRTRHRVRAVNNAAVLRALGRGPRLASSDSEESDVSESHGEATASPIQHDTRRTPTPIRSRPSAAELADEEAIALFDELLREEELRTLFTHRERDDQSESSPADFNSDLDDESDDGVAFSGLGSVQAIAMLLDENYSESSP